MFQFPAFPIAQSNCEGIPIRRSPVLTLRAGPWSLSQLGTSFIGTRAELSTRWHSSHVVVHYLAGSAIYVTVTRRTGPVDVWIARTHGFIIRPRVSPGTHSTLPSRAFAGWCIGSFGFTSREDAHLRTSVPSGGSEVDGPTGIRTQGVLLAKEALYR